MSKIIVGNDLCKIQRFDRSVRVAFLHGASFVSGQDAAMDKLRHHLKMSEHHRGLTERDIEELLEVGLVNMKFDPNATLAMYIG